MMTPPLTRLPARFWPFLVTRRRLWSRMPAAVHAIGLWCTLWRERRDLARLELWRLDDLGLDQHKARAEAARLPFDVPSARQRGHAAERQADALSGRHRSSR